MTGGLARAGRTGGRLAVAIGAAGALLVAAVATRLARVPDPTEAPSALLPLLTCAAVWLLALLTARRSPGLAWFATVVAAMLAVREPAALAGTMQVPGAAVETWLPAAILVAVTSTTAVAVGAAYATDAAGSGGWSARAAWLLAAWQAVAGLVSIGLGVARRFDEPGGVPILHALALPVALWPILPLALLVVGTGLAVRGPLARVAATREPGAGAGDLPAIAGALLDELLGRAASRRESERRERARLAAELHADVLPALRAAVAELESGGDPAAVGSRLATIAREVQDLTLERRDLILEELGLVAALEALAERAAERGIGQIDLDIGDAAPAGGGAARAPDPDGRPPRPVERAALRVADLAIANAARHGTGVVRVAVATGPRIVRLAVQNDGNPYDAAVAHEAIRRGARGLVEMREAAAEVDADLYVGPGTGSGAPSGAVVRFGWPRP